MRKAVSGPHVRVGIQGTEANETRSFEETNASLAAIHEFGSKDGRIPSRPFMRGTMQRNERLYQRMLQVGGKRSVSPSGSMERELGVIGERVRSDMIRTINQSIGIKENAERTIELKGSTTPLIRDSILKNSITWVVKLR